MTQATTETAHQTNSTYTLMHKTIGDIRGRFFVPAYQRGYRWDRNDVDRLLNDIWDSRGTDYSLQPIVVKLETQGETESDNVWELIDGQQRLTTLYLILNYIEEKARGLGATYSLSYETRSGSGIEAYLKKPDESKHKNNIDFFHIYQAYCCIDKWFKLFGDETTQRQNARKFEDYLSSSVKVIWYQTEEKDATALFTRLNVGRIPLTDAELIKAALLSTVQDNRKHEIAAQWDLIERDLHRPDIWAFVAGSAANTTDEKYPTRISLLLDTLADEVEELKGKRPRYHTFDKLQPEIIPDKALDFWKKVVSLHAQILGWHEKPTLYNKIGFLVACGQPIGKFISEAKKKKKSEFEKYLISEIKKHINVKCDDFGDLSYEKTNEKTKLQNLLLLFNIETSSKAEVHFSFSKYVVEKWSLEHIHAQNAETLTKVEQWRSWLTEHKAALDVLDVSDEIKLLKTEVNVDDKDITAEKFKGLSQRILKLLNRDEIADHSIRNLALLSRDDNSSLSNSVFEVKRQKILDFDREGCYVPICTRNVFLKYYANADAQQPHFWSEKDKESYYDAIVGRLSPYFTV